MLQFRKEAIAVNRIQMRPKCVVIKESSGLVTNVFSQEHEEHPQQCQRQIVDISPRAFPVPATEVGDLSVLISLMIGLGRHKTYVRAITGV